MMEQVLQDRIKELVEENERLKGIKNKLLNQRKEMMDEVNVICREGIRLIEKVDALKLEASEAYEKGYKAAQDKFFRDSDD